ncbi:MAG: hypothetical protein MJ223_03140 [Mycoplasmoidaceae bacterium]|nr:hypothetical protein [Mycoplasmoidaceae bacterium]
MNNQNLIDSLISGVNSIFASNVPEGINKACYYVGTAFSAFYGTLLLLLFAIIIGIFVKSGKPAFHDKFSNLVIYFKNKGDNNPTFSKPKESDKNKILGPGQLSQESLEEIGNI